MLEGTQDAALPTAFLEDTALYTVMQFGKTCCLKSGKSGTMLFRQAVIATYSEARES
jgi:hypothetical protein